MSIPRALATTLLVTVPMAPAFAADGGVRFVTLSSGGLAEVTRVHAIEGAGVIGITVLADQIDDVLKSLVVRDPGGAVGAITLDGPAQAEETFRRMPFAAEDLASPARLVGKLQGVRVRVASGGRTVEGKVLGVSEREAGEARGTIRTLSVLTDADQIDAVALDEGTTVAILDKGVVADVAAAVAAMGKAKADGARAVEIRLAGAGRREVGITYVVAAPVWKAAYRVVDGGQGKARLQAWAVIENAMGEDWTGVTVTLSSGAPVTLRQRLHQRTWRARPEAPIDAEGASMPDLDQGIVAPKVASAAPRTRALVAPAPGAKQVFRSSGFEEFEAAPAAQTASATEGDVSASYALPGPVDLAAGRTLSVPIVDTDVEAERIALYKPGQGPHPVAALMIRNGSGASLPPGILTVYDAKAGHVGDARLPSTPVGETRMASFATDRKISIQAETKPMEALSSLAVVDGQARLSFLTREVTTYTVKGAGDGARTVVIEHPRRDGWTFRSEARDSETPNAYRLKLKVAAGANAQAEATYERARLELHALGDADEASLTHWASSATDPKIAAKLGDLAKAQAAAAVIARHIAEIGDREERLRTEQGHIRENLGAVPKDSELARRYLARMATQEDELATVDAARAAAETKLATAQEAVRGLIRAF